MSVDIAYSGLQRFDSVHGRTQDGLGHGLARYPSPFFDIGHTYLPDSVNRMFKWCRYYFLTNPLINAVTYKMSEYPITPIIFDETDGDVRARWEDISENILKLRSFQIEAGLDYHCYGNAAITIAWPFDKWLTCSTCKHQIKVTEADYKFRNLKYYLNCEKCLITGEAKVKDHNIKNLKGIRLIRWNPENMKVEVNHATGETAYFFEVPITLRNDILMGKKHIIETVPHEFIQALEAGRSLRFTSDNFFHLKRPTIADKDMGWGIPLILPVLKDSYYLQILRKAQECIAQQHIVPLRVLFPQAGSATSDPYSMTDLGMWRKRIEHEISKWRQDPNYMPIMPIPVGNEVIGGEGKSLMLHQEMRAWSEQIVAGMHVPIEFVFGGLSYTGSNLSMKMLENQFLGYRTNLLILVRDFILGRVADYMGWPRPKCHLKRFKMADDLQRLALMFQFNQAMKISDTTLLDEADLDQVQEEKFKAAELHRQMENQRKMQIAQATLQGELMVIQAKYQAMAQKAMGPMMGGPPGAPAGGTVPGPNGEMPGQDAAGNPTDGSQQPVMGQQAEPGMPDGVTAYPEKGGDTPKEGIPTQMQSPLNMNAKSQDGQMDLLYLARRAATHLEKKDEMSKQTDLIKMKGLNPRLYQLVLELLMDSKGSQIDPMDPLQAPRPTQKPPRREGSI